MTFTAYEVRKGAYYDSVVLMQLQRALIELPEVLDAGVVMATPANLALLAQSQLLTEEMESVSPEDLLIVVLSDEKESAEGALTQVDRLLVRRRSSDESGFNPRSLEAAIKMLPEARWVLISVPGKYAARVASDALQFDKHVFLYSDNVSLEDEIELKREAMQKGLLVMGPDCGTALIQGVGLGFANRVRRGQIGLIGASGTGLQAITSKIHNLGAGISHAIGTGGRDLKVEVGGITVRQGLDLLAGDSDTKVIVLVSKPPDPGVAVQVLQAARQAEKPVVIQFMGFSPPSQQMGNLFFALNFDDAAARAVELLHAGAPSTEILEKKGKVEGDRRFIRGLFSGGSLANEALRALQVAVSPIFSNIPVAEIQRLPDTLHSQGHTILDLGEDEFTVGRLHPMMDNELRIRRIQQESTDPEVALILLDVVLGEGAHHDPAGELAPIIAEVIEHNQVEVVIILVGTEEDPQDLGAQEARFVAAGAKVFRSTIEAVSYITYKLIDDVGSDLPQVSLEEFDRPLAAINVGLESFYESLISQGASAIHVEWRPPAGGNEQLQSILDKMRT